MQPRHRAENGLAPGGLLQLRKEETQGDEAAQPRVLGLIDHAHATATEPLDDAVVRDGLVDHGVAQ